MSSARLYGSVIFALGCLAIGVAMGLTIRAFRTSDHMDGAVGAPPGQRGFVVEASRAPVSAYAGTFREMAGVKATAVLIVADPAYVALPQLIGAAKEAKLTPWLAVAAMDNRENYRAATEASARLVAAQGVSYLVVGLGLDSAFGDEAYWRGLLTSLRGIAPQTKLVFVTDYDQLIWTSWLADADVAGATGSFPINPKKNATLKELRDSWSTQVSEAQDYAGRFTANHGAGNKIEAAFIDVVFPAELSQEEAPTNLRALLRETKRQSESGGRTRAPLAAIFLRGWPAPLAGGIDPAVLNLRPLADVFAAEWATDTAPPREEEGGTKPAATDEFTDEQFDELARSVSIGTSTSVESSTAPTQGK